MTEVSHTLLVISSIVFFLCLIFIYIIIKYQILSNLLYKINESNKFLEKNIKDKYDLEIRIINIIERKLKIVSKNFEEIKKINIDKLGYIEVDRILTDCNKEIFDIESDYPKLSNIKSFNGIFDDLKLNEIHIISLKTYYNEHVAEYNNILKSFPNNIISKIKNYKFKSFYEGKELE